MRKMRKITLAALLFVTMCLVPFAAYSEVDWGVSGAVQLAETPIDVAQAQNKGLTFILTDQAKVLIYSDDGKLQGTVPVDSSVTDIAVSPKGEKIYLINNERKTLRVIDVNFIVDFNIAGSPFLGPADAKVVVAVFSDFQ
jgi:DNA-binding beta-propeller fold protein YncE